MSWLLNRLIEQQELPNAAYAFQGTTNWMRALAVLTDYEGFDNPAMRQFYQQVQRRRPNEEADTSALNYLLMALHNLAALRAMTSLEEPYSCVRSGIIAWYYSVYYASKAMIAASSGSDPQTHTETAKIFQNELVTQGLLVTPFDYSIQDLRKPNVESVIQGLRAGNTYDLNTQPNNPTIAKGGVLSYLKGTAEYLQEELTLRVRATADFKALGVDDFRTKAARALRDARYSQAHVNFLLEAFRYRGKANYRDAIYLSYGVDRTATLNQFTEDLADVSECFTIMAFHYVSKRIIRDNWNSFVEDMVARARFPLPFDISLA